MGLSEGRRGLGAAAPLGTLLFLQVDSAIWVTRAESWGWMQRKGAGVAHRLFFFSSPRRKDWDLGTLGTSRIVSKAGPGGGAEVSAEQQGWGPAQPEPQGCQEGREPSKPDAGFLISPSLYIFRKCRSLRRFEKRGIPAQTHPNRGWGGSLVPSSSRPKRSSQKGITLDCLHPQLPGPRSAPLRFRNTVHPPRGNHTLPGVASPSQG